MLSPFYIKKRLLLTADYQTGVIDREDFEFEVKHWDYHRVEVYDAAFM